MCSNIRLSRSKSIRSGAVATYRTSYVSPLFEAKGVFGLNGGLIYNVKSERRNPVDRITDIWINNPLLRGVIPIIGFKEGGNEFILNNYEPMFAAILYNEKGEFAILTENSSGVVGRFHRRMPVLIGNNLSSLEAWFTEGRVTHLDPQRLIRA